MWLIPQKVATTSDSDQDLYFSVQSQDRQRERRPARSRSDASIWLKWRAFLTQVLLLNLIFEDIVLRNFDNECSIGVITENKAFE